MYLKYIAIEKIETPIGDALVPGIRVYAYDKIPGTCAPEDARCVGHHRVYSAEELRHLPTEVLESMSRDLTEVMQYEPKTTLECMRHVERYGKKVWENEKFEDQRNGNCMCHTCARMKPGEPDHCELASRFYEVCKDGGCAFILTRCGSWENKDG